MIQETTAYRTEDGRTFTTRGEAELHDLVLKIDERIAAYVATLEGTDRAKGRQAAAIKRFLLWEDVKPCPET